jgi:hypothetical protein
MAHKPEAPLLFLDSRVLESRGSEISGRWCAVLFGKSRDDAYAKASFAAAALFLVAFLAYFSACHPPYDLTGGQLIGWDFVNTWIGAHAVFSGDAHRLFDFHTYLHIQHAVFPRLWPHNWSYPPSILLFIWPFGLVPYLAAYVAWSLVGLSLYLATAYKAGGLSKSGTLFLLAAPAVAVNLLAGQNGFYSAAALIGGFSMLDRRPLLAGICFGLLSIKPQLASLIPIALVLRRDWSCLLVAALTSGMLFTTTAIIFGLSAWSEYVDQALPVQQHVLYYVQGLAQSMMPTAFTNARVLGLSHQLALLAQLPFSLLAVAAVIWTFSKRRDAELSDAVLLTACFIVTPYAFGYDMVVFAWMIWRLRAHLSRPWDTTLMLAIWTLPVTTIFLGSFGIAGSGLVLPCFLLRLLWKLKQSQQEVYAKECLQAQAA